MWWWWKSTTSISATPDQCKHGSSSEITPTPVCPHSRCPGFPMLDPPASQHSTISLCLARSPSGDLQAYSLSVVAAAAGRRRTASAPALGSARTRASATAFRRDHRDVALPVGVAAVVAVRMHAIFHAAARHVLSAVSPKGSVIRVGCCSPCTRRLSRVWSEPAATNQVSNF